CDRARAHHAAVRGAELRLPATRARLHREVAEAVYDGRPCHGPARDLRARQRLLRRRVQRRAAVTDDELGWAHRGEGERLAEVGVAGDDELDAGGEALLGLLERDRVLEGLATGLAERPPRAM